MAVASVGEYTQHYRTAHSKCRNDVVCELHLNKAVINIHICIFPAPSLQPLPTCTGSDYNVEPQLLTTSSQQSKDQQTCQDTLGPGSVLSGLPGPGCCPQPAPGPLPTPGQGPIHWGLPGWPGQPASLCPSRVCMSMCASEWTWGWRGRPWLDHDLHPEGIESYDEVGITWLRFRELGREVSMALACKD